MRIFLIRHGETAWTLTGQHTGKTDLELTEPGRQAAISLGKRLEGHRFDKVFCSPSKRALATCALAGFANQAEVIEDLAEWDYGVYEGLTTPQIQEKDPSWDIFTRGAPGGESPSAVEARAGRVLDLVKKTEGDIALFSSGHFLRAFTALWLTLGVSEGRCFALSPATLSILGYERHSPVITLWNSPNSSDMI